MLLLTLLSKLALASDPETAEAAHNAFTMASIWNDSGFIARSVLITLTIMLIAASLVSIERLLAFGKARRQSMAVAAAVVKPLQAGDLERALAVTKKEEFTASYLASLLRSGLVEMGARSDTFGVKNAERAVEKAMGIEEAKLKRGMTILATVASTAPFVGLFGTTFGIINTFAAMSGGGDSSLSNISAGISEALITTAVGIGVAVVGVWCFNYFNARLDKVREEMIASEADFMDWAHKLIQPSSSQAGK